MRAGVPGSLLWALISAELWEAGRSETVLKQRHSAPLPLEAVCCGSAWFLTSCGKTPSHVSNLTMATAVIRAVAKEKLSPPPIKWLAGAAGWLR